MLTVTNTLNSHITQRGKAFGFTMVELLITIVIVGILATIAVPSYRDYVRNQRVKSASFELVAALNLTRSEAIKRNKNIAMTQAGGGWQNGWSISADGQLLRQQSAYNGVSITDSANSTAVTFNRDGRLASTPTSFAVGVSPASSAVTSRCISISLSGRANSKTGGC
ncbi:MAG: GspH/FimT family pseudopilin [Betaproteobacteria bacterium]